MKFARRTMSILTAAIAMSAWFAISNHCVIGATASAPETKPAPNECPFHASKSAPKKQSSTSPCCKILRAVPAKTIAKTTIDLRPNDLSFADFVALRPLKIFFGTQTLDTGPPGKTSFVELIGSVRAHAPPAIA